MERGSRFDLRRCENVRTGGHGLCCVAPPTEAIAFGRSGALQILCQRRCVGQQTPIRCSGSATEYQIVRHLTGRLIFDRAAGGGGDADTCTGAHRCAVLYLNSSNQNQSVNREEVRSLIGPLKTRSEIGSSVKVRLITLCIG